MKKNKRLSVVQRLLKILPKIRGERKVKTAYTLADLTNTNDWSATNVKIRKAAKSILHDKKIPIVSCRKGFYVATNTEEIDDYIVDLKSRIKGMNKDIRVLKEIRSEMK